MTPLNGVCVPRPPTVSLKVWRGSRHHGVGTASLRPAEASCQWPAMPGVKGSATSSLPLLLRASLLRSHWLDPNDLCSHSRRPLAWILAPSPLLPQGQDSLQCTALCCPAQGSRGTPSIRGVPTPILSLALRGPLSSRIIFTPALFLLRKGFA